MKTSFPKSKISVLLLENIHEAAIEAFRGEQFQVESFPGALDPPVLKGKIANAHIVGIRSKTRLTADILQSGRRLLAVGAFCIGTNQIDLEGAASLGVPVFNAPFSNTRSVAELIISHCISLLRKIPEKHAATHKGLWLKSADGCHEVRGKTLGIVGYGHIGSQVSVLAEAMGMKVMFYDVIDKLALGNAQPVKKLDELLAKSDIVTLHVPATRATAGMMSRDRIAHMKKGAYLINYSRGNVVDISALAESLKSGKLAGAAIDVFPEEPKAKGDVFKSPLQGMDNVILTPHIGGSTLEAQENIGVEVSSKLIKFMNNGSTTSAVNVPEVELPIHEGVHRLLHFHRNVPGVLHKINSYIAERKVNITGQYLMTTPSIGYLVMDVDKKVNNVMLEDIKKEPETIKARILY
ncbi:phosphoglycerate dehydrogenase [Candidatus Saganbacteria bacterium]|uniref:D-3-phosphoglycerate dehydrogenase n=1 Tax=Candidatus Saganbacteria bacterium TaxID=2575572 RepID=A0A9D6YVD4_UNCSA|nr:phosphoglycerate dehydrogenase [Candidatus Saganbacteria bacterium]